MPKKENRPQRPKPQIILTRELCDKDGSSVGAMLLKARRIALSKNYSVDERKMFAKIYYRIFNIIKREMPVHLEDYLRAHNIPVSKKLVVKTLSKLYFDLDGNPKWDRYEVEYLKNLRNRDGRIDAARAQGAKGTAPKGKVKKKGGNGKRPEKNGGKKEEKKPVQKHVSSFEMALEKISKENPPERVDMLKGLLRDRRITGRQFSRFAIAGSYTLRMFKISLDAGLGNFGKGSTSSLAEILLRIGSNGAHKDKVKALAGSLEHGNKILNGLISNRIVLDHKRDLYLAQPEFLENALKKVYGRRRPW